MSPAEEVRAAAERLRAQIPSTPRSPWTVEYLGDDGYPQRITDGRATLIATTYEGGPDPRAGKLPAYIAMMGPLLGDALAELLEQLADDLDDAGAEERPLAPFEPADLFVHDMTFRPTPRYDWTSALALARLILGRST